MFRNGTFLLPTDFSHYALYAMRYAVALAKNYDGTVHVAHVLDPSLFSVGSGHGYWLTQTDADLLKASMTNHAEERLAHLKKRIEEAGARAEIHLLEGTPAPELNEFAERNAMDMIITATHGRTGFDHVVFGSVAERIVRNCCVPVLCIKHPEHDFVDDGDLSLHVKRVLFPTDFSEFADLALPYAVSLCQEMGADLTLFHATEIPLVLPEFLPETAPNVTTDMEKSAALTLERMRDEIAGVEVDIDMSMGVPYREICRAAEDAAADLIVLPTHGHTALSHVLFGSVAEKVVRLAKCPVMTLRPDRLKKAPAQAVAPGAQRSA